MVDLACMVMPSGPVERVAAVAAAAEEIGFGRVWIPDEGIAARECWVTLACVAAATDSMQIGSGITNAYTRHPGVTAAAVATLDEVSRGRAVLGVGAGGTLTLEPLAIRRRAPVSAMRELVTTSRALWSGQVVDHDGVAAGFRRARLAYGRPDIPVWLAGRGPRVLQLAGELADGFIMSFVHKELIGDHVDAVAAAAAASGRPRPRLCYMTRLVTTEAAREAVRAALTFRLVDSPDEVKARLGFDAAVEDSVRRALSDGGPAAAARFVQDDWVDSFAICGTVSECRAELAALVADHSIDEFQISVSELSCAAKELALAAEIARAAPA
ncbi:MAG: LLM class flavin-dependent oxidoreductase [Acidimicrobiaceae bacterium]|nr:LLM class flavin-dependent oxidoreductase [Acidimicrobiaceae bacterium]MCY4280571.1 LLM class flavin-dependent oxidoreductase [Acidimicrobiaceae bacterium]MCY4293360.1 LLM class flavin-dependent oxidoreductase [Acidimicrobiaceae bacterium]